MKLKNSKHKVAVFCGSMFGSNKNFKDLAITVTKYLAQNDYDIVYGGGENGLMGVVAKTALKSAGSATPPFILSGTICIWKSSNNKTCFVRSCRSNLCRAKQRELR